jgi:hypothetical protein
VIIGAPGAIFNSGSSYLVFGKASGFVRKIDLSSLDGSNGFWLDGVPGGQSGISVATAGDVNEKPARSRFLIGGKNGTRAVT